MTESLHERIAQLEKRCEDVEERLSRTTTALVGLIIGLQEAVYIKAASESEDAQQDYLDVLENAIRNKVSDKYLEKYQQAIDFVMNRIAITLKRPGADRLARIYSPPPDSKRREISE